MKYLVSISGRNVVLNDHQLATLMAAVQEADLMGERHVGNRKGSQGYDNSYVPTFEQKHLHEWLQAMIVPDDFVDAVKLTMKLDEGAA